MAFVLSLLQALVCVLAGAYFFRQLFPKRRGFEDGEREARLARMRSVSLAPPMSERARPKKLGEIVGQENGLRALRAALFGPNPQHVILYGPPGVGKTCAARLIFEEARESEGSPFLKGAPFVELDATTLRCDERGIADPLIGSVHDPIYQGAGALGAYGVPQPREGAVTRAHGGVLFLDEIGEMHPAQMNRLLKVLEDRTVHLESAYYDPRDANVPVYVRDAFERGLPADFRLIAATTRSPQELPPALRSRCIEVCFRPLGAGDLAKIAQGAARRAGVRLDDALSRKIGESAASGRDAVGIVQLAAGAASARGEKEFTRADVDWVLDCAGFVSRAQAPFPRASAREARPGLVNALGVAASGAGLLLPLEAAVCAGEGKLSVSGAAGEEEFSAGGGRRVKRRASAQCAAENARMLLRTRGYALNTMDILINFPGDHLADGPSAGLAMAVAIASAVDGLPVRADAAVTGEISLTGRVLPVGGTQAKLEAARRAGVKAVLVPAPAPSGAKGARAIPVEDFEEAYAYMTGNAGGERVKREKITAV